MYVWCFDGPWQVPGNRQGELEQVNFDFHIKEYAKLKSSNKNSKFVDYKSTFRWLDSDSLYQAASDSLYQIHCLVIFIWSMHGDVGGKENCLMCFQLLLPCHDD